jgi:intracellular septation protein A
MMSNAQRLASNQVFFGRVGRSAAISAMLVVATLVVGTLGYVVLAHLPVIDAFHQSSLLMSGMGPLNEDGWSTAAKLFDSVYALFCGIVLLVSYGVLFAPILHRFMHKFHLEDAARQ